MTSEIVLSESHSKQVVALSPLQKKSIAEIKEDEAYRKAIIKVMVCGKANEGAHYGKVPGIKNNLVYKDGIQFLAESYYIGYGEPALSKEIRPITLPDGQVIDHYEVTAKVPIFNRVTGEVITVGVGSCSSLESKYRYRGEERRCPKCGNPTIIKGKSQYGGGWICYDKKGGCGAKFKDGDHEIEGQPVGKTENLNPSDVLDTVISMAIKRAKGRNTLEVTGMSRFFQLTPDISDDGPMYDGSREQEYEPPPPPPPPPGRAKPDPQEAEMLHQKLLEKHKDIELVESWVRMHTKGKFSDVRKVETNGQLKKLIDLYSGVAEAEPSLTGE
jgi:hypothetical protein